MNVSNTVIVGGLTKDVEVREVNGRKVANFTIAVSRDYKNADGGYDSDFYDCELWGPGADFMGKGVKGQEASAVGRFEQRSFTDKEGKRRYQWRLNASRAGLGAAPGGVGAEGEVVGDDEIPFA
jgi:single-strand DNA-binding protein